MHKSGREYVMRKLLAFVLVVALVSVFAAGCKTGDEGDEHPKSEHPAKKAAPKDHPAH
jgi:hypothetical protein